VRPGSGRRVEGLVGEPVQHGQRLEQHRTLAPQVGLGHLDVAEAMHHGPLVRRRPAGQVRPGQDSGVVQAAGVAKRPAAEAVDGLGDEALAPGPPGAVVLLLTAAAGGLALGDQPLQGGGVFRVGDRLPRPGDRQPAGRGRRPVLAEELLHPLDGRDCGGQDGVAVPRVPDGVGEHLPQRPAAKVATEHQPGVDRAGDRRSKRTGAGHELEAE
jgi:hypothetical protein